MTRSSGGLGSSEVSPLLVLLHGGVVKSLVLESGEAWLDSVSLSHLEVLSEVLVSAPPVGVDHRDSLVPSNLMEVRVSHVVLLSIGWESSVGVRAVVVLVNLSDVPLPLGDHTLLLLLGQQEEHKRLVKVPDQENVDNSDSVLVGQGGNLPESVAEWVLEESRDVLEGSPFLGHVSWLLGSGNELGEIAVSLLGEGSANHVSSLVHVWVTVHETFNTSQSLPEVGLRVLPIVQILGHIYY